MVESNSVHDDLVARTKALPDGDMQAYLNLELDWIKYRYPNLDDMLLLRFQVVISDALSKGYQWGVDRGVEIADKIYKG